MTESEARAELERRTDAGTAPALDVTDIDALLSAWVVTEPTSEGADDGVWNLDQAAAAGWRLKAGRTVNRINYTADGRTFNGREFHEHCKAMAELYSAASDDTAGISVDSQLRTRSVRNAPTW